ncbi:MAG TPA: alkaline phosphatase family protein [Steroidobacteraceae bacterium]|nr:alkaline phosphatase family protein [Steroidobacteraceae bacterium]
MNASAKHWPKWALLLVCLSLWHGPALAGRTRNVVLIVCDGLRWQEVFGGADPSLLDEAARSGWTSAADLRRKYGAADATKRRELLFPFLWRTVAKQGQLFGNEWLGSTARVTNTQWFSYPGYSEMVSGVADPAINSNGFGPNPNVSVFEWLNSKGEFHGKVEIFGTWGAFHRIFNGARSGLPIRAGNTLVDATDRSPRGLLMNELYRTSAALEDDNPTDAMLHVTLRDHLESHHPRVLFVGYGDTDLWQHMGRYDAFLDTAHAFDQFLGDLWNQLQSLPAYRGATSFIITADHGRGSGPSDWKDHGADHPGSDQVWIGVIGPDTPALGERRNVPEVRQAQIAATLAALLGEDFNAFRPEAAKPLGGVSHWTAPERAQRSIHE